MKKKTQRRAAKQAHSGPLPGNVAGTTAAEFEARLQRGPEAQLYVLRLFVTGSSPRSSAAVAMIRSICDEYLSGNYELEVVDLYQRPEAAASEQIIVAPTLIKQRPEPVRRMVGSLADRDRVLVGLEINPDAGTAGATVAERR